MVVDGATISTTGSIWTSKNNKFEFSNSYSLLLESANQSYIQSESFYGELNGYTPSVNGNASINMKRISYGVKFVAQDLTDGTLKVKVQENGMNTYELSLTSINTVNDNIYTFSNMRDAYIGKVTYPTNDPTNPTYSNYENNFTININWE